MVSVFLILAFFPPKSFQKLKFMALIRMLSFKITLDLPSKSLCPALEIQSNFKFNFIPFLRWNLNALFTGVCSSIYLYTVMSQKYIKTSITVLQREILETGLTLRANKSKILTCVRKLLATRHLMFSYLS